MVDRGPATGLAAQESLPEVPETDRKRLLRAVLRDVSRSFYLTLNVLPAGLRGPVGLAYLLARAADTIADNRLLAPDKRLAHLLSFRKQVVGPASFEELGLIGREVTGKLSLPGERELLSSLPALFALLEGEPEPGLSLIRSVVVTLTQGMESDLTTFPPEDSGAIGSLKDFAALDRYIYYVAGCVGEFWTHLAVVQTPQLADWNVAEMDENGMRFGKALQLTNVLRDVPRDLRMGRCYLPEDKLAGRGIAPNELLDPSVGVRARPVLVEGIETALGYFDAAERYVLATPRSCLRLRLAALWPLLIGLATLAKLARNEDWLRPDRPSKVSRRWVYGMMAFSWTSAGSDRLLRAWIGRVRLRVKQAL